MGELGHQPVLGYPAHPAASVREHLAGREKPVVAVAQRPEGAAAGAGWHGAGWHGAGWHGAGWHGAGWHGAGWHGAGWHGARRPRARWRPARLGRLGFSRIGAPPPTLPPS